MKRLQWVIYIWLVSLLCHAEPGKDYPNIVLIIADNLNPSLLGPYGNMEITTPNLDRMATEGMLFERAFAVSGVCSPTRASLLTGLLPSQTGVHNALPSGYEVDDWSAIEEFRNLPQTLKDAGYQTGLVGKYHLGQPDNAQLGFDYWVTFPSGHTNNFHGATIIDNGRTYWEEDTHLTDFWTEKAEDFIEESAGQDKPFFLFLSYNGPYNLAPVVLNTPDNRHVDYYRKRIPGSPQEPIHPFLKNLIVDATLHDQEALKGWRIDEKEGKNIRKKHTWADLAWATAIALNNKKAMLTVASETSMIDDGVGRIHAIIETLGLDEDTLIIFTSDQGAAYGQHGLWGNSSQARPVVAYDQNMRIPFIMSHPGVISENARTDKIINQYDVLPTLLEYIGLGDLPIENSPGKSFTGLLLDEETQWENVTYFEYILTRAIRTKEWKYVKRLLRSPDELYNLSDDPGENNNLIGNPSHEHVVADLDSRLTSFFDQFSATEYDVWRGGTAKAVLMYGGRNELFEGHFRNWKPPFVKKASNVYKD